MTSYNLHICSLNCQGLGNKEKRQRLKEWSKCQKENILFLQETHFTKEIVPTLENEFETENIFHSFGTKSCRGVSILIKKKLNHKVINEYKDNEGRIIIVNVEIDNNIISLVNIYAPNNEKDRNTFFKKIEEKIENQCMGIMVIGGDMNETLMDIDRKSTQRQNRKKTSNQGIKNMIKKLKLVDIWRILNPNKQQYTWRRKNNAQSASRIDFFLVNIELRPKIIKTDIRPAAIKYTDHQAISIKINLERGNKGKGYFKLNNSILDEDKYEKLIIGLINKYKRMKK